MEEYSNKGDVNKFQHQGDDGLLIGNISCKVNDHSETVDTNIASKVNEDEISICTGNKMGEMHDDFKINDQLDHTDFSVGDNVTSDVLENVSEDNTLKELPDSKQIGLSIESELENIHRDINNVENYKIVKLLENNEKMDWTDNVKEGHSANIQLTKESLEMQTGKTLQEVLEDSKDDSDCGIFSTPSDNRYEERMDIIEPPVQTSIPKTVEQSQIVPVSEPHNELESQESKSQSEMDMDMSLGNVDDSILNESFQKDKLSGADSEITSLDSEVISIEDQSTSLDNQPTDSTSASMESQSISLDSSVESQCIPFIPPICVKESDLYYLEKKAAALAETNADSQSIPLENPPSASAAGEAASLENESVSVESQSVLSENRHISVDSRPFLSENFPISSENQPTSSENQSSSVDSRSISPESKPISVDSQSISPESKPISVDSQTVSLENRAVPIDTLFKQLDEESPQVESQLSESLSTSDDCQLAETQSISSLDQPISLKNQSSFSLETESTSTDNQSISSILVERQSSPSSIDHLSTVSTDSRQTISVANHSLSSTSVESQCGSSDSRSIPIEIQNISEESSAENNAADSSESISDDVGRSDSASLVSLDQDKEKCGDSQRENTEFVQVNTENEKDGEDNEKDDESDNRTLMEHDPIGSDSFEPMNEDQEGADAELCIIPDTEREISQAEKDAASIIPPLRDILEASSSVQSENNLGMSSSDQIGVSSVIIFKYEKEDLQICNECKLKRKVKYYYSSNSLVRYICDDNCLNLFKTTQQDRVAFNWEEGTLRVKDFSASSKEPPSLSFIRKCASCRKITDDIENNLTWEIMDFCNEFCLSKYQKEIGSHCSSCQEEVRCNSLGKYCVRFGNDIRQFCTSVCLEKYKKGLKVCSYCQQDMSGGPEGFLAPVGDKGQFKDFCSQVCMEKYDVMTNDRPPKVSPGTICSVCKAEKPITIEYELDSTPNYFCGEPCFVAFSFVNNISPGKCAMCRRHFTKAILEKHTMYYDNVQHSFCSNSCENIYIIAHRKIVPCSWCKVKKYNFDMIRRYSKSGPMINMCSVNCLSLYRVSMNAVNPRKTVCNFCLKLVHPLYHLTMSDATLRNFCSYNCVMGFQNQFPKQPITLNTLGESGFPVPTGAPKKNKKHPGGPEGEAIPLPIISSVHSLASTNGNMSGVPPSLTPITRSTRSKATGTNAPQILNSQSQILNSFADLPIQVQIKQHFIVRPAPIPNQRNVGTMCYTRKANKGTIMKPIMVDEGIQTDEREASKILIPVPVPIYVPTPMHMFSIPTLTPVPFPVPVPVPILIPTTRNSAAGIMKEIKKIQVKIPTDPYEAELLMMAEMVAEEKKEEVTDSESDVEDAGGPEDSYSPEPVDASNTFGDDMLQMALKMATELDEPAVDLEGALTANTITAPQGGETHHAQEESVDDPQPMHSHLLERAPATRGRKRGMRQSRGGGGGAKRGRRISSQQVDMPIMQHHQVQQPPPPPEPTEKPDANMCLKYTFGVNAWKQWVTTKNAELEKSSGQPMLFKTEILQLTADELNYSLCLFVKEVRKPNGAEYAPDTIYYLCLGIQQYLFENGRIDNIFCDVYYEKFTDCLDEVAKKFSVLYNDSHYIVTRVEEEHLWESKQLGAHSPHVLLSTLMFFNTKHFNLTTVDEHMQLSFSHIMKHWKRNPNQPVASKIPGLRNVLLRFYPPQSAIQNNTRKKKVYEQEQNEENPLRCPVKLYEFYLSKCPESVKTRNDVFYLQPERSCVPDSPVWYSTMPLPREALEKMLHRVKMVKEINVALLTS